MYFLGVRLFLPFYLKFNSKKHQVEKRINMPKIKPPVAFPVKFDIITSNTKRSPDIKNKDINRPTGATQIYFVC